jgi:hypothetical protein
MNAVWTKTLVVLAYLSFTIGFAVVMAFSLLVNWDLSFAWRMVFLALMVPVPLVLVWLAQWKGRHDVPDVDADAVLGVVSFLFTAIAFVAVPLINNKTPDVDWATVAFAAIGLILAGIGFYRGFHNPNSALGNARFKFRAYRDRGSKTEVLGKKVIRLMRSDASSGTSPLLSAQLQSAIDEFDTHVASPKP